jgi:hypothetical protein
MVSEWAKKEKCWEAVREASLALPDRLPPELSRLPTKTELAREGGAAYAPDVTPADLANIEACKKVSGEEWLRIHAWGNKTGKLQKWQIGIAHTLAGYAASGWEKGPSPKQAKHGIAILRLAREDLNEAQA